MGKGTKQASASLAGSGALPLASGLGEGFCLAVEAECHFTGGTRVNLGPERPVGTAGVQGLLQPVCCVLGAISYTVLYNCLDFPAGVVPVTTVTAEDDAQMEHYQGYFGDIWDHILKKVKPAHLPALCCPDPAAVGDRVLALAGFGSLPQNKPHACCCVPSPRGARFLELGSGPFSPVLMSVSPVGHEEECRPACGRAVCGSALAGRDVSAVHAGGGTADDP